MTNEKLKKANELSTQINNLTVLNNNLQVHECGWIDFTFGNGSKRLNVCKDEETIEEIRNLISNKNKLKLEKLKKQFSEL